MCLASLELDGAARLFALNRARIFMELNSRGSSRLFDKGLATR